jgi:hypothetical protein
MPRSFVCTGPLFVALFLPACGIFRGGADPVEAQRERLRSLYAAQVAELQTALARIPEPVPMKPVPEKHTLPSEPEPEMIKPVPLRAPVRETAPAAAPAVTMAPQQPQPQQPQQPQEPVRHIDDREPPPPTREIQPVPEERRFWLDAGFGDLELRYGGTGLHDKERATFLNGGVKPRPSERSGAGLEASGWFTHHDVMEGQMMPAPGGLRPAAARVWGFDVFPHMVLQPDVGRDAELPVKVGPFLGYQRAEHDDADVTRRWLDFGARAVAEPELIVGRQGDTSIGIFARGGFDVGGTRYHEGYGDRDTDDNALRWKADLGAGVRLHGRHLSGELSYRWQHMETGELTSPTWATWSRSPRPRPPCSSA